jgi:hypothetical protein
MRAEVANTGSQIRLKSEPMPATTPPSLGRRRVCGDIAIHGVSEDGQLNVCPILRRSIVMQRTGNLFPVFLITARTFENCRRDTFPTHEARLLDRARVGREGLLATFKRVLLSEVDASHTCCQMARCLTQDPLPRFAMPSEDGDTPQTFLSDMEQRNRLQPIPATLDPSDAGSIIGPNYLPDPSFTREIIATLGAITHQSHSRPPPLIPSGLWQHDKHTSDGLKPSGPRDGTSKSLNRRRLLVNPCRYYLYKSTVSYQTLRL